MTNIEDALQYITSTVGVIVIADWFSERRVKNAAKALGGEVAALKRRVRLLERDAVADDGSQERTSDEVKP